MNMVYSVGLKGRRNQRKSGLEMLPAAFRNILKKRTNFASVTGYCLGIQNPALYPSCRARRSGTQ